MKRSKSPGVLWLLFALMPASVHADSWLPPQTRTYASADGAWRLTVKPRELAGALPYFEDKLANKPKAGGMPGDAQSSAMGRMEHREHGTWRVVWMRPLANDVSPVDAVTANSGQVATFDNWHGMGYGKDVVVIYDAHGNLVRSMGLPDFLPKEYFHALPRSVSSIHWRGKPRISADGTQLVVPVVVPVAGQESFPDEQHTKYVEVRFALSDGHRVPDATPAWSGALASARQADQRRKEEQAAARQEFISPLAPPKGSQLQDWHAYLAEAFFRLDPEWEDGYPATKVIPLPTDKRFALLSRYVGEALSDEMNSEGAIMVASPSQDALVRVLKAQAKHVKPGSLAKARLYVAVDGAHVDAAREAVAHTGVQFIQLDIDRAIPQRKARLDRYLKNFTDRDE